MEQQHGENKEQLLAAFSDLLRKDISQKELFQHLNKEHPEEMTKIRRRKGWDDMSSALRTSTEPVWAQL